LWGFLFLLIEVKLPFEKIGMVKISAVIITFNEEKNIGRCIDSIRSVADEIVVIDSYSQDGTKRICLEKNVRFVQHSFEGHIEQKNFALSQASYDHVLSLDADEYLSAELIKSILKIKQDWIGHSYSMNRLSSYGYKWIKHGNWYPDQKTRLWDRRCGNWGGENPHDKVILKKGCTNTHLQGNLMHHAYKNSDETLAKIQQYSSIFARENVGRRSTSISKIIGHSFFSFIKSYFIKRGFQDGFEGLMVAAAEANHVFYKYSKLYEANQRSSIGKRIVISRTDNLGDVVLTLPITGYLKSVDPNLEIYFIGKKYTEAIISQCKYVDHFLDREEIVKNESLLSVIKADTILFIYPDQELARIAKKINIPKRVSTAHRWFNWLYCNQLVDFSRLNSDLHESQLNFKLLKPFRLDSNPDLAEISSYYGLIAKKRDFGNLLNLEKFNLIIHPKSKGSAREWGLDNFEKLIKELPTSHFRIFVTGLREEGENIRMEMPSLFQHDNVTDLTGQLSLSELISFIQSSNGLLAGSTGVLHLAAALSISTVGLYSPMKPIHPGRWKPIGAIASYLVLSKDCNDCKKKIECACIKSITVEQVAAKFLAYDTQKFERDLSTVSSIHK
jgi:heptosyltransferase III